MKNLKNKAIAGMLWTIIDKAFSQVVLLFVVIILARELSPSDFGIIGMLTIFMVVTDNLINGGFSQALIQKKTRTEIDYSTVFYINLIVSLTLYLLLYFSAPLIADFYQVNELIDISRVIFLTLVINALCLVPSTILSIELNFKTKAKINVISLIISSGAAVYMALDGFGVWTIVYQNILKSLLTLFLLFSFCKWKPLYAFSKKSFKELFGFGSRLLFAGVVASVVNNLYGLLIGRYFGMKDVGYYMQGQRITSIIAGTLSTVLQGVTYPIMTSVQDDKERLVSIYKRVVNMTAFCVFPIMVVLAMISEPFVKVVLTEKWLPSVPIIQWLCFASMLMPLNALHLNILNATGRSDLFLKADLSKLPINLIVLFLTIPYGIEMVVKGQFLTRLIAFFINAYYPGKLYGYGAKEQIKDLIPVIISTILMASIIWFVDVKNPVMEIVYSITIGVFVYGLATYLMKVPSFFEVMKIFTYFDKN